MFCHLLVLLLLKMIKVINIWLKVLICFTISKRCLEKWRKLVFNIVHIRILIWGFVQSIVDLNYDLNFCYNYISKLFKNPMILDESSDE